MLQPAVPMLMLMDEQRACARDVPGASERTRNEPWHPRVPARGDAMFDYLGVLLSIIMGLALTHVLLGFVKLIQMRRSVRPYWVQIVWSVSMLLYVLAIWWGMYWWRHLEVWHFEEFVGLTGYSIVLFMASAMLFPMKIV